jgi:hypothetical protein
LSVRPGRAALFLEKVAGRSRVHARRFDAHLRARVSGRTATAPHRATRVVDRIASGDARSAKESASGRRRDVVFLMSGFSVELFRSFGRRKK